VPAVKLSDQDERPGRAQARAFVLPTSSSWSGLLLVTVRSALDDRAAVGSVLLVSESELAEISREVGGAAQTLRRRWTSHDPTVGIDEIDVAALMRRVGAAAEEEATFAGPLVKVNVRSHQESLAVMGASSAELPCA
jgi:hypothetical protein